MLMPAGSPLMPPPYRTVPSLAAIARRLQPTTNPELEREREQAPPGLERRWLPSSCLEHRPANPLLMDEGLGSLQLQLRHLLRHVGIDHFI